MSTSADKDSYPQRAGSYVLQPAGYRAFIPRPLPQRIRDEGDWESWLKFFLRGIYEVAQEATENARKIVQMREQHHAIIMEHFKHSAGAGFKLLEHLYQRPIITVKGATEITGQQYPNANNLIAKFQEHGMLKEMTQQQRNRRFIYSEYISILASEEVPSQGETSDPGKVEVTHTNTTKVSHTDTTEV